MWLLWLYICFCLLPSFTHVLVVYQVKIHSLGPPPPTPATTNVKTCWWPHFVEHTSTPCETRDPEGHCEILKAHLQENKRFDQTLVSFEIGYLQFYQIFRVTVVENGHFWLTFAGHFWLNFRVLSGVTLARLLVTPPNPWHVTFPFSFS